MSHEGAAPLPEAFGGYLLDRLGLEEERREELGSGRHGKVYRTQSDDRLLVLNVLKPGAPDRHILERFLRRSPHRIRHPSLPVLEHVGEFHGRIFFTTRLLPGDTLDEVLEEVRRGAAVPGGGPGRPSMGPMAVGPDGRAHPSHIGHAASLVADLAETLAKVREEGLVHTRLDPRGLIFSPARRLVISDVEHFRERTPEDSPQADVYALGAVLYETLTLEPPLPRAVRRGNLALPCSLGENVPRPLETCVLRALSKNPQKRHDTAEDFAADLRCILRGESPEIEIPTRTSRPFPVRTAIAVGLSVLLCATALWERISMPAAETTETNSVLSTNDVGRVPVTAYVVHHHAAKRIAELEILREEVAQERTLANADLVLPALRDPDLAVRGAAFRVFASTGRSTRLLEALGISSGGSGRPAHLDGETFLLLHQALLETDDEGATSVLCGWSLDSAEKLDTLPPSVDVELSRDIWVRPCLRDPTVASPAPSAFTAAWVAGATTVDPSSVLDAVPRLLEREELISHLLEALATIAGPVATDWTETVARRNYLTHGHEAIRVLVDLGASDALTRLTRSDLPLLLREAALASLAEEFPEASLPVLETMALTSPEAPLRCTAFDYLSRATGDLAFHDAILLEAIDDAELRDAALGWLGRLDTDRRARLAATLLSHPHPAVRLRVVDILSEDTDLARLPSILLRVFHPSSAVRRAALRVVRARGDFSLLLAEGRTLCRELSGNVFARLRRSSPDNVVIYRWITSAHLVLCR